ncbi:hypothetical protein ABW20_dc0101903 [Dactylellina cionopaga]|nr:hypothetical protein ABW20_dc0101903 [Dactylellina cionopaga]
MSHATHLPALLALLWRLVPSVLAEDLTSIVPTLTSLGTLAHFTPPPDCFSRSIWTTDRFYDNANPSSVFQKRFFTRWYVGCNVDDETGDYNTCCPPNYNTWGFYAPGVCPDGYSTMLNVAANPWVGDQLGTVCCPSIKSPSGKTFGGAGFATAYINPLNRDPISISCFEWDDEITTSGTVFQANYNGRAIIVFDTQLTSVTFQFAQLTEDTSTRKTTPASSSKSIDSSSGSETQPSSSALDSSTTTTASPGSTTTPGARQTGSESTTSSPVSSSGSTTSDSPSSTADTNTDGGGGGGGGAKLSGGAIAGIVIGVTIPIIAIAVFIAYKLGRKRMDVPVVPLYNDPLNKEDGAGGISDGSQWRSDEVRA